MPVRHARSETRGRPPCGRRGRIGKKGSTRSHNRSGSNAAAICRSRYFADEDQVREVLLRALRLYQNPPVERSRAAAVLRGFVATTAFLRT
jgi:hypothetical protein